MSNFRFGSHIPVLIKVMEMTDGPVLELGSGMYSTVFLHWACFHKKRRLVTMESKKNWHHNMKNLKNDWHDIKLVDWDSADISGEWSVAFIDQSPGYRRSEAVIKLKDTTDYIVIHDTEELGHDDYKFKESGMYGLFKYRFDYMCEHAIKHPLPGTTVLSNKHDLTGLMDK